MGAATCSLHRPVSALSPRAEVPYAGAMSDGQDDTALMLRYQAGDVAAFEALYRRHNDALYRYMLRLCRNSHSAEDLYQEAWSKIIGSRARYRPTAKFTTFLYRVAHNCFIDYIRRNKKHQGDDYADPDGSADLADLPDMLTEKAMLRSRLRAALNNIPDDQRDTFLLHEEAGLSLDAIAQVTGVNRETAKSRLRYANDKLKTALMDPALNTGDEA